MPPQTDEQKAAAIAKKRAKEQEIQRMQDELAAYKQKEMELRQLEEQLNKRQLEVGDGVEQGPRPKKTARETIEGYVAENDGDEAKDDIIAITHQENVQ